MGGRKKKNHNFFSHPEQTSFLPKSPPGFIVATSRNFFPAMMSSTSSSSLLPFSARTRDFSVSNTLQNGRMQCKIVNLFMYLCGFLKKINKILTHLLSLSNTESSASEISSIKNTPSCFIASTRGPSRHSNKRPSSASAWGEKKQVLTLVYNKHQILIFIYLIFIRIDYLNQIWCQYAQWVVSKYMQNFLGYLISVLMNSAVSIGERVYLTWPVPMCRTGRKPPKKSDVSMCRWQFTAKNFSPARAANSWHIVVLPHLKKHRLDNLYTHTQVLDTHLSHSSFLKMANRAEQSSCSTERNKLGSSFAKSAS